MGGAGVDIVVGARSDGVLAKHVLQRLEHKLFVVVLEQPDLIKHPFSRRDVV